jgi:hypothetical protein
MPARQGIARPVKPKRKSAPYPFILEAPTPLEPEVRAMFSGFAVYFGEKILLMLRDSPKHPEDNGIWLVFSETAHIEIHLWPVPRARRRHRQGVWSKMLVDRKFFYLVATSAPMHAI